MHDFQSNDRPGQQTERTVRQIDRLYMPAMPPLGLIAALRRAMQRRRFRRRVRKLLAENDHILCDLGFARGPLRGRIRCR